MNCLIIPDEKLTQRRDSLVRELLSRCFPGQADEFAQKRYLNNNKPDWNVIIETNQAIIANLAVLHKHIIVDGRELLAAGLANVCVCPEHRGQNLAQLLLASAMQQALREYDMGLLFCDPKVANVYIRAGWKIAHVKVIKTDECGNKMKRSETAGYAMYYPIADNVLPKKYIDLQGDEW